MLNDDLFISFKEVALYYLVTYLEYYATRKQTLQEDLYLPVGPWNHYIHLTLVDNSRVVQEDKEGGSFFSLKGVGISDVTACCCWYVRVGGTVQ